MHMAQTSATWHETLIRASLHKVYYRSVDLLTFDRPRQRLVCKEEQRTGQWSFTLTVGEVLREP